MPYFPYRKVNIYEPVLFGLIPYFIGLMFVMVYKVSVRMIDGDVVMPNSIEIDLTQLTNENKVVISIYKIDGDIKTVDELIKMVKGKLDKDCLKFKRLIIIFLMD